MKLRSWHGGWGVLCMLAGWWWRKGVKRRLDMTKMFLLFEAEKSAKKRAGDREEGRTCMKADVRRVQRNRQV